MGGRTVCGDDLERGAGVLPVEELRACGDNIHDVHWGLMCGETSRLQLCNHGRGPEGSIQLLAVDEG